VDPSGLLKGAGGSGSVSDLIGGSVGDIDKINDALDSSKDPKAKKCKTGDYGEDTICSLKNGLNMLKGLQKKGKDAAKESAKTFIPEPVQALLPDSLFETPKKDTNTSMPNSQIDNNATGSTACQSWWANLEDESDTIFSKIMCK